MKHREIKFRGKRADTGEWIYGSLLNDKTLDEGDISSYAIWSNEGDGNWFDVEPDSICQFTGLTDKNGVEIYEGDVLKERYYPLGAPESVEYYKIGVVMWPNGVMWKLDGLNVLDKEKAPERYSDKKERYKHPTQGYDWVNYQVWFHRSEVIGNIFENPEMIEV